MSNNIIDLNDPTLPIGQWYVDIPSHEPKIEISGVVNMEDLHACRPDGYDPRMVIIGAGVTPLAEMSIWRHTCGIMWPYIETRPLRPRFTRRIRNHARVLMNSTRLFRSIVNSRVDAALSLIPRHYTAERPSRWNRIFRRDTKHFLRPKGYKRNTSRRYRST